MGNRRAAVSASAVLPSPQEGRRLMHFESMLDSNRQMTPNDPHKLSGPMANKEFVAQASEYVQQKMKSGAPPRPPPDAR